MPRRNPPRIQFGPLAGLSPKKANFVIEYTTDFNARRSAVVSGYDADYGCRLRALDDVAAAIDAVIAGRLETSDIDAEWVLMRAVENSEIALQEGKYAASNTALAMVGKHVMVDAFAADRVILSSNKELIERLQRGRARLAAEEEDEPLSFL